MGEEDHLKSEIWVLLIEFLGQREVGGGDGDEVEGGEGGIKGK